ncbi:hypothetical protein FFA01_16610 [Frigoribacterium faeni]|uniref:Uncharacterized protein n=1 Tax=Frigoribacterium faeni TaxID=145483 RepID=A0ABQ0UPD8_9MICO|nr:hypothetical protein GCM10025699_63020 [Microbacterium flavescens]GEK83352.1 hypothetical protein FFA01_16610 [Frigoribacterium faeni]
MNKRPIFVTAVVLLSVGFLLTAVSDTIITYSDQTGVNFGLGFAYTAGLLIGAAGVVTGVVAIITSSKK